MYRIKIKQEPEDADYSPVPSPAKVCVRTESMDFACDKPFSLGASMSHAEPTPLIGHRSDSLTDLGPDNYDVVDIKVEGEEDEDEVEVDIETVTDSMPGKNTNCRCFNFCCFLYFI